ncbi:hypothetical protein QC762_0017910 [Podospora pseudocomata]|uniref:LysM domain-containing protein n=1 Tax=Podospora pseudocomata TaxID=2093779 RepID=A0ABR0GX48_9PEZI|nr:hypothetical protein QC762_0017910 [Podospora pseudocomata]
MVISRSGSTANTLSWFVGLLSTFAIANAQQFSDGLLGYHVYPGLSDQCAEALNTTITNCASFLATVAVDMPRLDSRSLETLCTATCRSSLSSVRGTIASRCRGNTDVLEIESIVYPATFVIDRFLYAYDISCAKDRNTGRFCDQIYMDALSNGTASNGCSDCALGVVSRQLNSPFGYHPDFANDFRSKTSECGATGYTFTSPAPYAISTKPNASPTDIPTCVSPYTVQAGDTCDAIAAARGVSTHSVVKAGGTDPDCTTLQVGVKLCLPEPCKLYRVQYDDTCERILAPPGRTLDEITRITTLPPTTTQPPETAVPRPTNAKAESHTRCGSWYEIQEGDYCQAISIRQAIPLQDFFFLNPSISNPDCLNLWLETSYCVKPVGDINMYSDYPYSTSPVYTLTSSNYVTTTASLVDRVPPIPTPIISLPLAPGSRTAADGCLGFVNHRVVVPQMDQSLQTDVPPLTNMINSCDYVLGAYEVHLDEFLSWNPSLVAVSFVAEPSRTNRTCMEVASSHPGTIPSCSCYTVLKGRDAKVYPCEDIALDHNITVSDLMTWNPWIGPSSSVCDTGIYANLPESSERPICVGTGTRSNTSSVTSAQRTTTTTARSTTPSLTTSDSPGAPTQTGIVAGCRKYYIAQAGDGCWAIASSNNINLDDFYGWNPAVGTDCLNLWPNYAYCVQGPASMTSPTEVPTTTTAGGVPPPGPTQDGANPACKRWHTVVSGDDCAAIQQRYGVPDFATFLRWNPSIGSNYENLWLGYSVCVGI